MTDEKTASRKMSIYAAPSVDEALAHNGGGRNRSHRLAQIADRYTEILRRAGLPDFSGAEWSLMRDAMNSTLNEPAALIRHVAAGIEDAILLDGLAEKWDVSAADLLDRLRGLSFSQRVALVEKIEAWGARR